MHNILIDLLKWPVAISLVAFAWFAARQLPAQIVSLLHLQMVWVPLALGTLCYATLWRYWLRSNKTAVWAASLEHELTHVIASLATFNGVHRLQADSSGSGYVTVSSSGNWIILVAPYVFPTSLLVPGMQLTVAHPGWFSYLLFGVALGFHMQSTCAETHCGQTDLEKVGWPAAALLLPACHIVFAVATVGVLLGHQDGLYLAWKHTLDALNSTASSVYRHAMCTC
jgi:hypothetical protein